MGEFNQIGKEVKTFNFCLRWVYHVISNTFLTLTWKSESLLAKILKSSMDTI